MDAKQKLFAYSLATAAAFAFVSVPLTSHANGTTDSDDIVCFGSNACKGQSACVTTTNSCQGQNGCKGMGITMQISEEDCLNAGGKTKVY